MPVAPPSVRRAFTLVELLIVIAIIVVLASLLLAALGGARNTARTALTKTIITTVQTGFQQFRADTGRVPGVFSQRDFASSSNTSGLTQMENALLELSYDFDRYQGIGTPTDAQEQGYFQIDAGVIGSDSFEVVGSLVGSPENMSAYIDVGDRLAPAAELVGGSWESLRQHAVDSSGELDPLGMPDILDAWDNPIMLWQRNRASADRSSLFLVDFEDAPASDLPGGAKFHWRTNAGYLTSFQQVTGDNPSLIRADALNDAGADPLDPTGDPLFRTMDALLGHPSFPNADAGNVPGHATQITESPSRELSDVIFHSAGRDGIYLEKVDRGDPSDTTTGTQQALYNIEAWGTNTDDSVTIDQLDDVIQAGG
ncbi:MAG: prepilin-type N-terminal cleavage/methylation domain-containing protein [Planctomycetota bacterium]